MGEAGLEAATSGFFFGGMVGEELQVDLGEDHEVDEDEPSACAPYLARQMSCLGSRTLGVKDTPFLGSVDRKSTRLNSSHSGESRMPSSA